MTVNDDKTNSNEPNLQRREVLRTVSLASGAAIGAALVNSTAAAAAPGAGDAYGKVATVIGEAMDNAWKDIIAKLASGNAPGAGVSGGDLQAFFGVLATADMNLVFRPATGLSSSSWGRIHSVPFGPGMSKGPGGAEVSIGIGIRF
jgi:hypothetical protein